MINLIPPAAKKKIVIEYWTRVLTVWLATAAAVLMIASVFLLPSYVLLHTQIAIYAEGSEQRLVEVTEYNTSVAELISASNQARLWLDQKNYTDLLPVINLIENIANPSIRLESYHLERSDTNQLEPIIITGRASTREALADFRESLLSHADIETAVLPLSNLVRDRDISFSITVTLTKPKP